MSKRRLRPNEVTDEQGRRRFHGAFTGGFSAGYFNTVGSAEGWQPKTFSSSRTNRAEVIQQRPEDFMDAEDGLLGRQLAPTADFDTLGSTAKEIAKRKAEQVAHGSAIPGPAPVELTVPAARPIGKRLLATMGWREGQGIGPRVRSRKSRRQQLALPAEVLGSLPEQFRESGAPTFAPENTFDAVKMPAPKLDMYGLGYDVYKENPELAAFGQRLRAQPAPRRAGYRTDAVISAAVADDVAADAIKDSAGFAIDDAEDIAYGSAVGEFSMTVVEDIDDDNDHISKLRAAAKGWIQQPTEADAVYERCPSDGKPVLKGFRLASRAQLNPPFWKPVTPPPSFTGRHHFDESVDTRRTVRLGKRQLADVDEAAPDEQTTSAVSETKPDLPASSVFHLLSAEAYAKLNAAVRSARGEAQPQGPEAAMIAPTAVQPPPPPQPPAPPAPPAAPEEAPSSLLKASFAGLASSMSKRFSKATVLNESVGVQGLTMPEALRTDKPDARAGQQQQHQQQLQQQEVVQRPKRRTAVWVPAPLLCKRFNVPVPDVSQGAALQQPVRKPDVFDRHIAPFMPAAGPTAESVEAAPPSAAAAGATDKASTAPATTEDVGALHPVDFAEEHPQRPSIEVFKSIFEDESESSSGEEESEKQEEEEEEEEQKEKAKDVKAAVLGPASRSGLINEDMLTKAPARTAEAIDPHFKPVFRKPTQMSSSSSRQSTTTTTMAAAAAGIGPRVQRLTEVRSDAESSDSSDEDSDDDKTASVYGSSDDGEGASSSELSMVQPAGAIGPAVEDDKPRAERRSRKHEKHEKKHSHKRKRKHKKEKSKHEKRKKKSSKH